MTLVVLVRHLQMLAPEEQRVRPAVERLARPLADLIAGRVAENGRRNQRDDQQRQVQVAARREESRRDEQRVAGQEEADEQSGLRKDDQRQAELADDADQFGNVVDGVKEMLEEMSHAIQASACVEILFQVVDILDADRDAHQVVGNADLLTPLAAAPRRASSSRDG